MARAIVLVMLLGGASAAWHPGIPTGWDTAPCTVKDFTNSTADPWRYSHRLGLYKMLLQSTTTELQFDKGWGNPLWGLPLQFSWQHDTGRLASSVQEIVNTSSWWANVNYVLSVIPFVAAVEAGLIPNGKSLTIAPAIASPVACTSYSTCLQLAPNATSKWLILMKRVKGGNLNISTAVELLWDAHLHSLHEGIPLATPLVPLLPSVAEAHFGLSWANLVDFVAALRFDVNYNNTNMLQALVMPPRILHDNDSVPHIHDFSGAQNRALLASDVLYSANQKTGGRVLQLFQRLCCTESGRVAAYNTMIGFMQNPSTDGANLLKVLWDLVRSHPC